MALDVRPEAALLRELPERLIDAQSAPQPVEHRGPTRSQRLLDGDLVLDAPLHPQPKLGLVLGLQEPRDAERQTLQLSGIDAVLTPEVVEDLVLRPACLRVANRVGELQVADLAAVLALAGDTSDVHAHMVPVYHPSMGFA